MSKKIGKILQSANLLSPYCTTVDTRLSVN